MSRLDRAIPVWVYNWLLISALICIIDGGFCVLRPHSLPGGCLQMLFYAYKYYILWDKHYADETDSFIWTQGFGNLVESALNLVVYFNLIKSVRLSKMLAIVVCVMTAWKTVLFDIYSLDIGQGGHTVDWLSEVMVFGASLIWIFFPGYAAWVLMEDFLPIPKTNKTHSSGGRGEDSPDSPSHGYNLRSPTYKRE
ncbi:hypothetical protein MAR_011341 [Mya arenaria]|uniref:Uncharacterized protein n=2 Tax=Mya arenaria TaxID=6604 RepID=A0ABY7FVK0_MYAAR|nr:uncharacterized protein LOC128217958 isoform X2 [Mya arenaria]XP_052781393.1 uncharacterized protein LOC128217958 isoform X2 [Mya arenaria]XP_052781394.1 uncharacterized protein LOC128217958 isoform X2 [Mya arenaria]XP_052781395.1 uncharacterized protein LOC128217958 isoform X2 [Mya arenaria]XP_052781396.1 uncharacterized protein LOC128217958 isoform X2 [Mya arenaria]WAR25637.1 hypothetical protein MAR_011341 [Mya arenaria]